MGGNAIARWLGLSIPNRLSRATVDRWFDDRLGIVTTGYVPVAALRSEGGMSAEGASAYQPVSVYNLMLVKSMTAKLGVQLFVDIGCGKGRACFYGATEMDVPKILGIDVSNDLIQQANRNLRAARLDLTDRISFKVADAREFRLPWQRAIVFLFNPFGADVMRAFVSANLENLRALGSVLVYVNDVHRDILLRAGLRELRRRPLTRISLWAWPQDSGGEAR